MMRWAQTIQETVIREREAAEKLYNVIGANVALLVAQITAIIFRTSCVSVTLSLHLIFFFALSLFHLFFKYFSYHYPFYPLLPECSFSFAVV